MQTKLSVSTTLVFLVLGLVWGLNYLWAKNALGILDPKEIVTLRVAFGFFPLFFIAVFQAKLSWQHLRYWPHLLVMSALTASLYFWFFKQGIDRLDSGIAAAISGSIPVVTFIGSLIFLRDEPISRSKLLGLCFGVIGVVVLAQPWVRGEAGRDFIGVLAVLIASLCLGASFVYARKFVAPLGLPVIALVTYQFGLATITMLPFTDFGAIWAVADRPGILAGVIIGNGIAGSGLAAFLYYILVREWGALQASSSTLTPPVVGLVVGFLVLGEQIGPLDVGATGLILLGVVLLRR